MQMSSESPQPMEEFHDIDLSQCDEVERRIEALQNKVVSHPMYDLLTNKRAVQIFMEHHCYSVMDFMCLLKSLQQRLTVTSVPWFPPVNRQASRFINEIVVAEESDEARGGGFISHYTMYIEAMDEAGADSTSVENFVEFVRNRQHYRRALRHAKVPKAAQRFVKSTMEMCLIGKNHEVASFFVFGRECLIPAMFHEMVATLKANGEEGMDGLIYYLDRHIEVDGDEHGPMARQMLAHLCDGDERRWSQVEKAAIRALEERLKLWDAVEKAIKKDQASSSR